MAPDPRSPLSGVIPVLHTCWKEDGSLDADSIGRQLEWVISLGVDGCAIALASDILRMSPKERIALFQQVAGQVKGRAPIVMSVGAETAEQAMAYAAAAKAAGATALMAIPPRSRPTSDDDLMTYYEFILDAAGLPVIVQDASGYVGAPMSAEVQAALGKRRGWDRIWFKPEANPVEPVIRHLTEVSGNRAVIFEGSGGTELLANHALGVTGTMPGCDLLDAIVRIWKALGAGDTATAQRLSGPVAALARLQGGRGLDGYLALERHLMMRRGLFASARMRSASDWTPDAATLAEADRLFGQLQREVGV